MQQPNKRRRALILLVALVALYALVQALGLGRYLGRDELQALVEQAGPWGPAMFVVVFVVAVLAQIPGVIFIVAAPFLFAPLTAWVLCLVASNIAVNANFAMVRKLGGTSLDSSERPWVQRLFDQLDSRPVRSIALLRVVLIILPPVTAAVALTPVSPRHHALGSALGILVPITAIVWGQTWLISLTN